MSNKDGRRLLDKRPCTMWRCFSECWSTSTVRTMWTHNCNIMQEYGNRRIKARRRTWFFRDARLAIDMRRITTVTLPMQIIFSHQPATPSQVIKWGFWSLLTSVIFAASLSQAIFACLNQSSRSTLSKQPFRKQDEKDRSQLDRSPYWIDIWRFHLVSGFFY